MFSASESLLLALLLAERVLDLAPIFLLLGFSAGYLLVLCLERGGICH